MAQITGETTKNSILIWGDFGASEYETRTWARGEKTCKYGTLTYAGPIAVTTDANVLNNIKS